MSYETYTTVDWLMFFYIYCFLGWCFESTYVSIQHKKWINRGFMRGPFLPPVSYTHLTLPTTSLV